MSVIEVDAGPYGLEVVSVYTDNDYRRYKRPLRVVYSPEDENHYATIRVLDAENVSVAFARCMGDEVEEAKQWLLDFTEVSL